MLLYPTVSFAGQYSELIKQITDQVAKFNKELELGNMDRGDELLRQALHLVQRQVEIYAAMNPDGFYPKCICNETNGHLLLCIFSTALSPLKRRPLAFFEWSRLGFINFEELPAGAFFYLPDLNDDGKGWLKGR